ncbi:WS/DGAT domain-containing protein [Terrabacter tumescens]|nr:WS/DGAT domain-containing protein [Terrabacter tumescens]
MTSYAGRLTIAVTADVAALPDFESLVAAVADELQVLVGLSAG